MTSLYSSTAVPKQVFGEGELLTLFYNILKEVAPAAWELNETMLDLWNPETLSHNWIMPDNFHVVTKVMDTVSEKIHFENQPFDITYKVNQPMAEGRSLGANMVHSIDGMIVREMVRRCDYDPIRIQAVKLLMESGPHYSKGSTEDDKMVQILWGHFMETGYLSARILDHLTQDNAGHVYAPDILFLIESLPAKPFTVLPIHDCFRCLPQYGNDLRRQYNIQLKEIAQSDLLGSLISQILGRKVHIGKLDPTLSDDILDTNYALS